VASWWFRYAATHRAAKFWGPETARLIRDAPLVELREHDSPHAAPARDISRAPGLTHLRNALLEDRSYRWPAQPIQPPPPWRWAIEFAEPSAKKATLFFSADWQHVSSSGGDQALSCQPIANGLAKMLGPLVPGDDSSR
jgi:hypothetical protein